MAINDHLQQKKNTLRNMCCSSALHRLLTVVRGQFERNKRVQVSDLYDNIQKTLINKFDDKA